ncbi:MAG: acyl-CoA thioesterase [Gammaproteobacteria bacterium]
MSRLSRLLERLTLRPVDDRTFLGGAGAGGVGSAERLFGGLVAAQAFVAAQYTVPDMPVHSLHAYFLRPGRAHQDITFQVEATKDGRQFRARSVSAWQGEARIFQLMASFQQPEDGVQHQAPVPDVAAPEDLPNRDALRGRANWRDQPIDVRMATPITADAPLPPEQRIWLRANGALPDDPRVHAALLVYASDRSLLDTAWRPHADRGALTSASLDHAIWFHAAPRFDDWLLYTTESPAAAGGRGLAFGAIHDRSGRRIATVAQEGVLRTKPSDNNPPSPSGTRA